MTHGDIISNRGGNRFSYAKSHKVPPGVLAEELGGENGNGS